VIHLARSRGPNGVNDPNRHLHPRQGKTRFAVCWNFRYQIGTTLTETARHAMKKPGTRKILISRCFLLQSRFAEFQVVSSESGEHGAVNRLVAGSNPARGAKSEQALKPNYRFSP